MAYAPKGVLLQHEKVILSGAIFCEFEKSDINRSTALATLDKCRSR